ncbi:hypothetical protein SGLAM104S_07330 [Streptomyces glaucescens]
MQKPHWTAPGLQERLLDRGQLGALTGPGVAALGLPPLGVPQGRTGGTPARTAGAAALGPLPGVVREALHGDDVAAFGLPGGDQAGADRHAVEAYGARAALALLAGVLGARQPEPFPQHVEQGLALPDVVGFLWPSVDGEADTHHAAPFRVRRVPRYDSQVQVSVRRAITPTARRR